MGYTHYWTRSDFVISISEWKAIIQDVKKIVAISPVPICYEYDSPLRRPRLDEGLIRFNGKGDDGHETFYIERSVPEEDRKSRYQDDDRKWSFCKTAHKPYDVVATAILAYLDSQWPALFSVTSDGDSDEWAAGIQLASEALPDREIALPRSFSKEQS